MCMDCPEQEEGALVMRWKILSALEAMESEDIYEAMRMIEDMLLPTNDEADEFYKECNQ